MAEIEKPIFVLEVDGKSIEIDARPSDSIAFALRANAPIYVSERIVPKEIVVDKSAEEQDLKKFKKYIKNLQAQ